MNTGSNPVGVAGPNVAESQGAKAENCTSEQVHVPKVCQCDEPKRTIVLPIPHVGETVYFKDWNGHPRSGRVVELYPGTGEAIVETVGATAVVIGLSELIPDVGTAATHGKNGAPPLPSIPEEAEQPNDKQPPEPWHAETKCEKCGEYLPCNCRVEVRACKGSYGPTPQDRCDAVLGPEVAGDYCSVCQQFLQARTDCLQARASEFEDASELAGAMEDAWQNLAEHPSLDPRTVAICKKLHDMEVRGLRLVYLAEGSRK